MTVKETNMHTWDNKETIDVRTASFIKNPWMHFSVFERKGKLDFGGGPNKMDGGNSLQYFAQYLQSLSSNLLQRWSLYFP